MGIAGGNRLVAFSSVIRPIGSDAADVLTGWDLIKQFRQHRRITNIAGGDLDCPNLQCFLVDPNVYLAPDASFGTTLCPAAHACMCERDACEHSIRLHLLI